MSGAQGRLSSIETLTRAADLGSHLPHGQRIILARRRVPHPLDGHAHTRPISEIGLAVHDIDLQERNYPQGRVKQMGVYEKLVLDHQGIHLERETHRRVVSLHNLHKMRDTYPTYDIGDLLVDDKKTIPVYLGERSIPLPGSHRLTFRGFLRSRKILDLAETWRLESGFSTLEEQVADLTHGHQTIDWPEERWERA